MNDKPFLLSDLNLNWKAFELWKPNKFRSCEVVTRCHENTRVDVASSEDENCFSGDDRHRSSISLRFGDFLDLYDGIYNKSGVHWIQSTLPNTKFFLAQCPILSNDPNIPANLPNLLAHISIPSIIDRDAVQAINLWINLEASRSNLHYDAHNNLIVVVFGCKRFALYSPKDTHLVYPHAIYSKSANHSSKKFDGSIEDQRLDLPNGLQFTLQSGDALFVPEGWWHQVDSDPSTIAVNFWYNGLRKELVESMHLKEYYVRVLIEEMLKEEKRVCLVKYRNEHCPVVPNDFEEWHEQLLNSTEALESPFFAVEDWYQMKLHIRHLFRHYPKVWRKVVEEATPELAEYLTGFWETSDDQDMEEYYAEIFSCWSSDEEIAKVRTELLAKKEYFSQQCYNSVINRLFGLDCS